jgi:hypothetical protein
LTLLLDFWVKHFEEALIISTPVILANASFSALAPFNRHINPGILQREPQSTDCHAVQVDIIFSLPVWVVQYNFLEVSTKWEGATTVPEDYHLIESTSHKILF